MRHSARGVIVFACLSWVGCADPAAAPTGNPWDSAPVSETAPPVPTLPSGSPPSAGGGNASTPVEKPMGVSGRGTASVKPTLGGASPPVEAEVALPESRKSPLVGHEAPDVQLRYLSGGEFHLASFRNQQVVVMAFWNIAEAGSLDALKRLDEIAQDYRNRGVLTTAVNVADPHDEVVAVVKKAEFDLPIPHDEASQASINYKAFDLPVVVVVDRDGIVQAVHNSLSPDFEVELRVQLDALISGKQVGAKARPARKIIIVEESK